jgi:hypothetical protein
MPIIINYIKANSLYPPALMNLSLEKPMADGNQFECFFHREKFYP